MGGWLVCCFKTFYGRTLVPFVFCTFEPLLSCIVDYLGVLPRNWKGHICADEFDSWDNKKLSSSPRSESWWLEEVPGVEENDLRMVVGEVASRLGLAVEQDEFLYSLLRDMLARESAERPPAPDVLLRLK